MTGRHRATGPEPEPYASTRLDARERAVAAELTAKSPGWIVIWGPYWRCWSAFALFSAEALVVHAGTTATLLARMRQAELTARTRRG